MYPPFLARKCDILFMDNLSAHKAAGLEELIRSHGAHLI